MSDLTNTGNNDLKRGDASYASRKVMDSASSNEESTILRDTISIENNDSLASWKARFERSERLRKSRTELRSRDIMYELISNESVIQARNKRLLKS